MTRLIYPGLQGPVLTAAQRPEAVTEDRWHQPFSEPTRNFAARRAAAASIAIIASGAFNPTWNWGAGNAQGLAPSGWSQPPATKRVTQYQEKTDPLVPLIPENVTADKWIYPWSEPVRLKPGTHASRQAFFFAEPFGLTQPEGVHMQWWQDFSLPRWSKTLPVAHREALAWPSQIIGVPSMAGWWMQPSEPRWGRAPLPTGARPSFTIDPTALTVPEAVHLQWHQPFSLPRWQKTLPAALRPAVQTYSNNDPPPIPPVVPSMDSWFMRLSLPVLPRSYFSTLMAWSGPIQTMQPPDIFGDPFRTVYVAAQTRTVIYSGEQQ